MNRRTLLQRSLVYYWRTNLAVVLGVAAAVAVLSGALVVGDSVRGSLRSLVLQRLGKTDRALVSTGFFRETLSSAVLRDPEFARFFSGITPMIVTRGFASVQGGSGGRSGNIAVYGVDDRFWTFHGLQVQGPSGRAAFLSPALAAELGTAAGETLLVRVERPTDMPLESLHGRKDDTSRTLRTTVQAVLARESLGEFTLQAQQGDVRAVFVPLALLQEELDVRDRANTMLVTGGTNSGQLEALVRRHATPEDLGLRLRALDAETLALESRSSVIDDAVAVIATDAAAAAGLRSKPILTYLANTMKVGEREIPYSLVTAMDLPSFGPENPQPILLNDWALKDLGAKPGDALTMEYFVWEEPGRLSTRSTEFRIAGALPVNEADRNLAPVYPGITDAAGLRDWNPPFPIDLRRVRPVDEDYWKRYGTTPKAFIPLAAGQTLWRSRYGALTSIRFASPPSTTKDAQRNLEEQLQAKLDPFRFGMTAVDVRAQSLDASQGATNFGEYFVYFSFFLVVSALLLSALFFKLSVEQRIREVGLLRAVGLPHKALQRLFLTEGLVLSVLGALLGVAGAAAYAWGILWALRTRWVDAVGTQGLGLHLSTTSLLGGAIGGIAASVLCIAITLRGLRAVSERSLLAGELGDTSNFNTPRSRRPLVPLVLAGFSILLIGGGIAGKINQDGAFFGGGFCLLAAALTFLHWWFGRPARGALSGSGWRPLARLALRNASYRPARSVTAIAVIASASFILIAVDAFRKDMSAEPPGGYSLIVETLSPIAHDPNSPEGRRAMNLEDLDSVQFEPFRVRPGEDASCLNLYVPRNPQILAPRGSFLAAGGFQFQGSLATTDAERANPWALLAKPSADGTIPVIADANSLTYVLHKKIGDEFEIPNHGGTVRLKFVAALSDSIFQGALLMSEANFLKLFPEQQGYSLLLGKAATKDISKDIKSIEDGLSDYGADVTSAAARLASFHRVENTYLSTFQMLGGLGLLLGTVGLAAILLRSVLERRRELALLRILGYTERHLFFLTVVENVFLLICGLFTGGLCAAVAIAPAALARGGHLPAAELLPVFAAVSLLGLLVAVLATKAALRGPLLASLRSE